MTMVNVPVEPPITDFLYRKATRYRIPLSASFELTPVCNMACKMCYVRMTKSEQEKIHPLYSADEWIKLSKVLKEHGMLYLLLTGGEPFLREDLPYLLKALHDMGFIISINSNGTLIDESVMEWLKRTPPVRINMTLYGASDETYERLCGNPKGFTQVTHAIQLLKEAGITVKLNCSVTPYNATDLDAMVKFAREQELLIQPTSYMFPPIRRDESKFGQNDRFTPKEAAYYSARIESLLNGEEAFLKRMENRDFPTLSSELDGCLDGEGDRIRCRAGKCTLWVTWNGTLLPCGMMPESQALNVFEEGFEKSWEVAKNCSDAIRLPVKCKTCPSMDQCKACAAMVYTETGSFDQVPEYRCKMNSYYPDACRKIETEIKERKKKSECNETE